VRRFIPLAAACVLGIAVALGVLLSTGSPAPPDSGAAQVIPAGALAWLNVSLDRGRPEVRQAQSLPGFALARAVALARLGAITGAGQGFAAEARPWIGDEAALAVMPAGGARASGLVVLAVRRPSAARRFLGSGRFPGGAVGALARGYMVIGSPPDVRAALEVARGRMPSLAGNPAFQRVAAGEPPGRVLDLYASGVGTARLLGGRGGFAGALSTLLAPQDLTSLSVSLSTAPGGARVQVHRVLSAPVADAGRTIQPSLAAVAPAGAALFAELADLPSQAPRLLSASSQLGVGGAVAPLLTRLGAALRAEGVDVHSVLRLFRGETAVSVTLTGRRPAVLVLARARDQRQARVQLAELEPALASLFPAASSGPGAAPLFTSRLVNGITIHQLDLGPGLQLDYAVWRGLIGVSTGVAALAQASRRAAPSLSGERGYRTAVGSSGEPVGSLVFLDLRVLLRLGEQTGLLRGTSLGPLAPVLGRIRAIGLRSTSEKTDSTAELYLEIP